MKPLVLLRTFVVTAGILIGAFFVFTGLANLPRSVAKRGPVRAAGNGRRSQG